MERHTSPRGLFGAVTAMTFVGTLTGVSATIQDYPVFGGQGLRYAVAAAILLAIVRFGRAGRRGRGGKGGGAGRGPRLRGRDLALLAALAATGLAAFNVFIVAATHDTSPATIGTVIAAVPIALALVGPLLEGRRPAPAVVVSACVVTAGAALSSGLGGGTARGLLLSLGALAGEVCFSLLAVPLLPRLGPLRVSAYSAALAAPMMLAVGLAVDGAGVLRVPTASEAAGLAYLAAIVTTVAFCLWYDALGRLGAAKAGLFAGLIPVSAVVTTMVLGLGTPGAADLAGAALVAIGVVLGMRPPRHRAPEPGTSPQAAPPRREPESYPV